VLLHRTLPLPGELKEAAVLLDVAAPATAPARWVASTRSTWSPTGRRSR